MKLSLLLEGWAQVDSRDADPDVTHLALDSRRCRPGSLFLAVRGARADGVRFVPAALEAGAVAVVGEGPRPAEGVPAAVPWVQVEDVRRAASQLARRLYAPVLADLDLVAVTGTKGKTTTTRMLGAILTAAGRRCATVGTLGAFDAEGRGGDVGNTTPDPARMGEVLAEFAASGHAAVALEASSQAAVQERVRDLPLAALGFLNLTPEHAELHPTMDEYRAAKAKLFTDAAAASSDLVLALPAGDLDGQAMRAACGRDVPVVEFEVVGEGGDAGEGASASLEPRPGRVRGRILEAEVDGLHLELALPGGVVRPRLGFGGRFNLQNALAAAALAHGLGVGHEAVFAGLDGLPAVPGRFQVVRHQGVHALVDYAHSSAALDGLLASCRELVGAGRLLLVFGCGGQKDESKRPRMGRSAALGAEQVWVTNDNPRGEDPQRIADQVLSGIPPGSPARVRVELDRRRAIRAALEAARPGDLVVIAGKGHETTQTIGDTVHPFDDLLEVRRAWGLGGEVQEDEA